MQKDIQNHILQLMPGIQLATVATVTKQGHPRVRYVAAKMDNDLIVRFSTYLDSDKIQQIQSNPHVHMTCGANDFNATDWLQIEGKASITTSKAERESFWFDGLKRYVDGVDDPQYCVVIVQPSCIEIARMFEPPLIWRPEEA